MYFLCPHVVYLLEMESPVFAHWQSYSVGSDTLFLYNSIVIIFNEYCPEKVNLFNETSLSHQTIGRKIDNKTDSIIV